MNATEHLIEAFRARKAGFVHDEYDHLSETLGAANSTRGTVLNLPALLSALAEIVVGEPCVSVPVREVEAVRDARSSLATNPFPVDAILARLPAPKVDHVAILKVLRNDFAKRFDDEGVVAALEAAIAAMEKNS